MIRVMKYCVGTPTGGMTFQPARKWDGRSEIKFRISCKSDSEYMKDPSRHSVNGWTCYLEGTPINMASKMMPVIALSVTEAESAPASVGILKSITLNVFDFMRVKMVNAINGRVTAMCHANVYTSPNFKEIVRNGATQHLGFRKARNMSRWQQMRGKCVIDSGRGEIQNKSIWIGKLIVTYQLESIVGNLADDTTDHFGPTFKPGILYYYLNDDVVREGMLDF